MDSQAPAEYVLYLRKSKGRAGIGVQRRTTTAHIDRLGGRITAEFKDTDRTAFRKDGGEQPKREGFEKMIAMLRARPGLGVAAWHSDRLTRNEQDTAMLGRACRRIETKSGGSYDLSTANGRKRFRDDASDAQYEVDHNRERVLEQKAARAADGHWLGGHRPFGWQAIKAKPKRGIPPRLVLDQREAPALAQAHQDILDRKSLHSIARGWNAAGLATSGGKQWTANEVRRVLVRPMNAALPPARWPAITDAGTCRAVVALLSDPARKPGSGPERRHLLSGLALCGLCASPVWCTMTVKNGHRRYVYRCSRLSRGHVARDEASLDAYVSALVIERLSRADARALLLRSTVSDLPRLERERGEVRDLMRASNQLRRRGLLTAEEFAEERAEHQERLAAVEAKIAAAEQADVLAPMIRDPARVWETRDLDQKRAIIDALMVVTVQPQPLGRPKGWAPGEPYFDREKIDIEWRRK